MLPLIGPSSFVPETEPPAEDESSELYERLKSVAKSAVPEIENQSWVQGFNRKILPHQIPYFLMRVQGYKIREIAETMRVSQATVRAALNSPAGQELLRELYASAGMAMADVTGRFKEAALEAVDIVIDLAQTADKDETRLKAAFSILDRAGYGVTSKKEVTTSVLVSTVTSSELDEMRAALRESLEAPGEFEVLSSRPLPMPDESQPAE